MDITQLGPRDRDEAVDVLCDAFVDYPVMRFIVGPSTEYDHRLNRLIGFFTAARFLGGDIVLGVTSTDGALAGIANITRPGERPRPPELPAIREALWRELGDEARERYEGLVRIWQTFAVDRPNFHLNMLGVRRSWQRRGAARLLLDAVHGLSAGAPDSCGVTLSTEDPVNVPFYERFGYRVVGETRVADQFTTWGFFRPDV